MKYGKAIGTGNTSTVYEWKEDQVIKLFNKDYSKKAVEYEFHNAKIIENMNFAKAKAHGISFHEGQYGIIYDKVYGESLLDWVTKTFELQKCAVYMANLHKKIISNKVSNVSNYKNILRFDILKAKTVDLTKQKKALQKLDKLEDGNTLCHGDFHPGNIFISNGKTVVIDFMNICQGVFLYDIARTVFLVEYTPVSEEAEDREMLLQYKRILADLYLVQMNVTRVMIKDYLSVISIARIGECPDEYDE